MALHYTIYFHFPFPLLSLKKLAFFGRSPLFAFEMPFGTKIIISTFIINLKARELKNYDFFSAKSKCINGLELDLLKFFEQMKSFVCYPSDFGENSTNFFLAKSTEPPN